MERTCRYVTCSICTEDCSKVIAAFEAKGKTEQHLSDNNQSRDLTDR